MSTADFHKKPFDEGTLIKLVLLWENAVGERLTWRAVSSL
jgi:hypothetical protein